METNQRKVKMGNWKEKRNASTEERGGRAKEKWTEIKKNDNGIIIESKPMEKWKCEAGRRRKMREQK